MHVTEQDVFKVNKTRSTSTSLNRRANTNPLKLNYLHVTVVIQNALQNNILKTSYDYIQYSNVDLLPISPFFMWFHRLSDQRACLILSNSSYKTVSKFSGKPLHLNFKNLLLFGVVYYLDSTRIHCKFQVYSPIFFIPHS